MCTFIFNGKTRALRAYSGKSFAGEYFVGAPNRQKQNLKFFTYLN